MAAKPKDILDRIISSAQAESEHALKVSRDFWDEPASDEEYDALDTEFRQEYEAVARQIAQDWGPPDFQGDWETEGFPDWYPGQEMAYWTRGDHVAYVAFSHQDKELPMTVTIGAVPRSETEETA